MEAVQNGKAEVWRERVEDQRASGQTVRGWCQARGIRGQSFYWWRRRLGLGPPIPGPATPGLARVRMAEPAASVEGEAFTGCLRLRLAGETRGGARVRELILPASMPTERVAELVRALERTW